MMLTNSRNTDRLPEGNTGFNPLALGRSWLKQRKYYVSPVLKELRSGGNVLGTTFLFIVREGPLLHCAGFPHELTLCGG